MARTIAQIQADIIAKKNADATLAGLDSPSDVAIWRLWTYVVAFCMWTQEVLFDSHKAEVAEIIKNTKPGTAAWYVMKAKAFQYGATLPVDTDVYPTVDEDALIVARAAYAELPTKLRIKVAKLVGGDLAALSGGELTALNEYLNRIKYAGVRVEATSAAADTLKLKLTVYYDPLVLDATGARLDGTAATPVKDAVNLFLADLPFNGLFIRNRLAEALAAIDGVVIADIRAAEALYAAVTTVIAIEYTPDAGYMVNDEAYFDIWVQYVPHTAV